MDVDQQGESKKMKMDTEKDNIDMDEEEPEMPKVFIEQEMTAEDTGEMRLETQPKGSTSQIIVAKLEQKKKPNEELALKYKKYSYATTSKGQFKSKSELFSNYKELRKNSIIEVENQMSNLIKPSDDKVSLMTIRDSATDSLKLAVSDKKEVSELHLETNQISIPDKICLHKQTSEVLYADLTKETLTHNKSKKMIVKLEMQLKQEKANSRAWATQLKLSQAEIAMVKEQATIPEKTTPAEKAPEKVQIFKRRAKSNVAEVTLPPQAIQLQEKNATLKVENTELKDKSISLEYDNSLWKMEKEHLLKEIEDLKARMIPETRSPTSHLVHDMSEVSLKDLEISQLKEQNQQLQEELAQKTPNEDDPEEVNKLLDRVTKMKNKTKEILPLKGAKHLLWDELIKEMTSFRLQVVMVDEQEQDALSAEMKCKVLTYNLHKKSKETA